MTSKEQGLHEEPVGYWVSTPTPLLTQQAAFIGPDQCLLMLFFPIYCFCKIRYVSCTRNAQYIKINNCDINVIAQVPDCINTYYGYIMTWGCRGAFIQISEILNHTCIHNKDTTQVICNRFISLPDLKGDLIFLIFHKWPYTSSGHYISIISVNTIWYLCTFPWL